MNPVLAGQIRTVLAVAGGFAVAKGWTDAGTVEAVSGLALAAAASLWSAKAPEKRKHR